MLFDQFRHEAGKWSSERSNFANNARAEVRIFFRRHHENSFYTGFYFAVHQRHLQLELVVTDSSDTAQNRIGALLDAVGHEQALEGVDRDVLEFGRHCLEHLDALFNAEEGTTLLLVLSDSDDESVKQFAAPVNEVEVSVGNGIERAGVDGGNLFQCASRGRK